jgi:hypothetical protein
MSTSAGTSSETQLVCRDTENKNLQRIGICIAIAASLSCCWIYAASVASVSRNGIRPGVPNDYAQMWAVGRGLLHGLDPYGSEVTLSSQIELLGAPAKSVGSINDIRLTYPLQAVYLLLPLSMLTLSTANILVSLLFGGLTALSVPWLRQQWDRRSAIYVLLLFSSYPVVVALQMRQPTLFFFGFIVGSFVLFRSEHFVLAGIVAAFAAAKPQIAVTLLLPMLALCFARWDVRRRFLLSFGLSVSVLTAINFAVDPSWLKGWADSMHTYKGYVHPSVLVAMLGRPVGIAVSACVATSLVIVLWILREEDPMFLAAISTVTAAILIQGEMYNMVILLVPAIWIADHFRANGSLLLALVRVSFLELWLANIVCALLFLGSHQAKAVAGVISQASGFPVLVSLLSIVVADAVRKCVSRRRFQH